MSILSPRVWTQQPQFATALSNESQALSTFNTKARLLAFQQFGWINLATSNVGRVPSIVGTVSDGIHIAGIGQKTAGGGRHGRKYSAPLETPSVFTAYAFVFFYGTTGTQVITGSDDLNIGGWRIQNVAGDFQLVHIGQVAINLLSGAFAANTPYFIACSRNNPSAANYVVKNIANGTLKSGTVTDSSLWTASTSGFYPVGYGRASTESVNGVIQGVGVSDAFLALNELISIAQEPYQIFRPRVT